MFVLKIIVGILFYLFLFVEFSDNNAHKCIDVQQYGPEIKNECRSPCGLHPCKLWQAGFWKLVPNIFLDKNVCRGTKLNIYILFFCSYFLGNIYIIYVLLIISE